MAAGNVGFSFLARSSAPTLPTPKASAARSKSPKDGVASNAPQFDRSPVSAPELRSEDQQCRCLGKAVEHRRRDEVFTTQPKRASPITHCKAPDSSAIHTAI